MRLKTWAASLAVALTLPFLHGCGNDDAQKGEADRPEGEAPEIHYCADSRHSDLPDQPHQRP